VLRLLIIKYLKIFILCLITIVEKYEYSSLQLDEDDISKKILESHVIEGFEVLTDTGWSPISHIHKTQPYKIYKFITESGKYLECADNHIIFDENMSEVFVKDLNVGSFIQTKDGLEKIILIESYNISASMFDITVDDNNHRFYTNDILSHNTICSAIFIAWYLTFNFDKNALILANKGATTKEIIDKTKVILGNIPFFMKPGVIKNDVFEMKFDNGCRMVGQTTTGKAGIGFTIHLLFLDEFAHVHPNFVNSFYENVYPTLSSSKVSRIIITSTPNGYNLFYEIYKGASERSNEYAAFKVDWWQVPGRDEKWKEQEIKNLGSEEAFNRQYGNQFLASSNLLLQGITIKRLQKEKKKYISHDFEEFENIQIDVERYLKWDPDFDTVSTRDDDKFYLFSIDTAEGNGGDYSVINIFEVVPMLVEDFDKLVAPGAMKDFFGLKQVARFASNEHSIEDFSKIAYTLAIDIFNAENVKIVLEWNYNGALVMKHFQTLFPQRNNFDESMICRFKHRHDAKIPSYGLKVKKDNKIVLCQNFKKCIEQRRYFITDEDTIKQLETFGKTSSGSYGGQLGNDDLAMSGIISTEFLTTADFSDFVEEMLDTIDQSIVNKMEEILYNESDGDGDTDFDIYSLVGK
jgi:hypothetical protein